MTSIAYRERRQLTRLPSSNGLRVRRHHPTPPRVLKYRAGGLRKKRGAILCPLAKPSLLPIVRCALRRDERGNVARSRLYFVGYVTVHSQPKRLHFQKHAPRQTIVLTSEDQRPKARRQAKRASTKASGPPLRPSGLRRSTPSRGCAGRPGPCCSAGRGGPGSSAAGSPRSRWLSVCRARRLPCRP